MSLACVIVLAIATVGSAAVPDPAGAAADAKRLAALGADSTTPRGAMKRFVLALQHHFDIRMADVVAPGGKDDEDFIADYDAVTAAFTRLRTESDQLFGDGPTQKVGHGILAEPTDDQMRKLFAQIDSSIPGDVKGDSVDLGRDAAQFYAKSAVRRDGRWRIALYPQVTMPAVVLGEFGDIRSFAAAVGELADGVAKRRITLTGQLDAGLDAAFRRRGESIAGASDLKALQGKWERKPFGDELDGDVVARVIGTVDGVHLTTTYLKQDGKVHRMLRARMTPSLSANVRVMTFSDLHHPPGETDFGLGRKGQWRKCLYALRGDTWTEAMGFLEDDKRAVGIIEWKRLAEKPETPKQDNGKPN
jgi:hypothetical protein